MEPKQQYYTRQLVGDKEALVEFLQTQRDYAQTQATDMTATRRYRDRATGEVDGLDYAIKALQDWVEAVKDVEEGR